MRRSSRLLTCSTPIALFALLLAGCATSLPGVPSYDASSGTTQFESAAIPLGRSSNANYASSISLVLRAEAECMGEGCEPSSYVVYIANRGGNEYATNFSQVRFTTTQGTVSFESGSQVSSATSPTTFFNSGRGELVRISVPPDIFASFAVSRSLDVQIGAQEFNVPYDVRSSFRRMANLEE